MTFLLVLPVVLILVFYLLILSVCRAAGRADRRLEEFHHGPNGWRNR